MLIALGDIHVQVAHREVVRQIMRDTQTRVTRSAGCLSYVFAETLEEPGHFVLLQQWSDRAALEEHYRSEAFASYQARIAEHLVRSSDLRLHEVQSSLQPVDHAPIEISQED